MRALGGMPTRVVGRGRTRLARLALALMAVVVLAGVVAAAARSLAFDDAVPCPAAYTEDSGEFASPPPFICPGAVVGRPYAVQLVGRGGCEPNFSFAVFSGALPPGLSLTAGGLISGAPTRAGNWAFWVRAQDRGPAGGGPDWCTSSQSVEGEFMIAVQPGVIVTTESIVPGTVGVVFNVALSAHVISGPGQLSLPSGCASTELASGSCPLTWSVVQGQLPGGLRLNPVTGAIWGTPAAEGSSLFIVRAALDDGRAGTKSFTIAVRRPLAIEAPRPFGAPGQPTLWEVGVPFAARFVGSGGSGAYSWSLADGALPKGLVLGGEGTVAGTPRVSGSFQATIHLVDSEGRTVDQTTVIRVASRLAIGTHKLPLGKLGRNYRANLASTGGLAPKSWKVQNGVLPSGIRLDRARGVLTGRPARAGRYHVTLEVADALGVTSSKAFVIDVVS